MVSLNDFACRRCDALAVKVGELADDMAVGDAIEAAQSRFSLQHPTVLPFKISELERSDRARRRRAS